MNQKLLSVAFRLSMILGCITPPSVLAAPDELPLPQKQPACYKFQTNAQNLKRALVNPDIPSPCRTQVEESFKRCAGISLPDFSPLKEGRGSVELEKQAEVPGQYSSQFAEQAEVCAVQQDKVSSSCSRAREDLKLAREQNTRARIQQVKEVSGGIDGYKTTLTVNQQYDEVTRQLTAEINAASSIETLASQVLEDKYTCFTYHHEFTKQFSKLIQDAFAATSTVSNNNGLPNSRSPKSGGLNASDRTAIENLPKDIAQETATYLLKKKYGQDLAAYMANRFGQNSLIATGAREIASTAVSSFGLLWATFTTYFSLVGPAGHACDMIYEDPLQAESLGCTPTIRLKRG